jgi:hypothetical protein
MPVTYAFRGEVLEVRAVGTYTLLAVKEAFRRALTEPGRPSLRARLYDVGDSAVVGSRTTPEVRDVVAYFDRLGDQFGRRVALLAATDVGYGVMRMVAGWAEGCGFDVGVFRDPDEAITWASR